MLELPPSTWAVLECADGTRDAAGIALAATRLGTSTAVTSVIALVDQLHGLGMLEEGPPSHSPTKLVVRPRPLIEADLPVAQLPDFTMHCDGSGGCCATYSTILLTPDDVARARATIPEHTVGEVGWDRMFTPSHGSAPTPLSVPIFRNGACGFLGEDGACEIHRAGGLEAKPSGCAAYPLALVNDGVSIRVTTSTECGCVLASVGRTDGAPLLDPSHEVAADLPPTQLIRSIPAEVEVGYGRTLSRAELRRWVRGALETLAVGDPAARAWALSDDLAGAREPSTDRAVDIDRADQMRRFTALADAVERAYQRSQWRSSADGLRDGLRWFCAATKLLTDASLVDAVAEAARPDEERFYLRAFLWGYGGETTPLALGLRDRATRIWVARAMEQLALVDLDSPRWRHPLAVVDGLMRSQGLATYQRSVSSGNT